MFNLYVQATTECTAGVVTGCQVDWVGGATNNIRGAYPGPQAGLGAYSGVSGAVDTENQCTAEPRTDASTIRGGAQCVEPASGYELGMIFKFFFFDYPLHYCNITLTY